MCVGPEALRGQPQRVGPRDLEHVEVGVDLEHHARQGRERLVEHHPARRQRDVEAVDRLEDLPQHLAGVDLADGARRVAVEDHPEPVAQLLLHAARVAHAERAQAPRQPLGVLVEDVQQQPHRRLAVARGRAARLMPKSTRLRWSGSRTRMFAGCGSAWKKPWTKTICIHVSVIRFASRRRSSGAHSPRSSRLSGVPSTRSIVSTRAVV